MKGRKSETAYLVECDRELQAGTDNQSGCPGDTNFSVHHPPPHPILGPVKVFSVQTGRWWLSPLLSGSPVQYVSSPMAGQDLGRTDTDRPDTKLLHKMYFWVGTLLFSLGGAAVGVNPRRSSLQRQCSGSKWGYGVWGLGMACLGRIHQHPIELSKPAKEFPLLPHICQVPGSKSSQI